MSRKMKKALIISGSLIIGLFIFFYWQNNSITVNNIEVKNNKVPNRFNDYKILQISDLHNKEFGKGQKNILNKIKKVQPDIIVVTGDIIDSGKEENAMELMREINKIAPVYFVSGNHEAWGGSYNVLKVDLKEIGITVLDNEKIEIIKGNDSIELLGLLDNSFINPENKEEYTTKQLNNLIEENDELKILLSHRPELFDTYAKSDVDLVFSGHAHGGQFRIPFVGGVVAPDQGLFPKYPEGIYIQNDTSMVVSRGLGNSIIPVRIFNRPEIVVVTLKN
ncbi:MAG: metallophosphoesterase [Sarcina sp.]